MAYLKLMMDEKEIAHLSEDGQSLCANEGVPQYDLPLNLFIGDKRKFHWSMWWFGQRSVSSRKSDGLQRDFEIDGAARLQRLGNRQAHQRLPDGRPLLAAIQRR